MPGRFRIILLLLILLTVSACVSTGTKEITRSAAVAPLEPGKSTKAEVTSLLGFPALVSYGPQGQETWNYYYVTEYPQAVDFVPVADAFSESFKQSAKLLSIGFDRQGLVQNLQKSRTTGKAEIYPY